jgi:hypothetical protein
MRYRAPEKLEIIRLVEQSSLAVRRSLAQLGIPRATFYRYRRYLARWVWQVSKPSSEGAENTKPRIAFSL